MKPLDTFLARLSAAFNSAMAAAYLAREDPIFVMGTVHTSAALLSLWVLWKTRRKT